MILCGKLIKPERPPPNEVVVDEQMNCAHVVLYDKNGEPQAYSTIDIEDIDKILEFRWCWNKHGNYALGRPRVKNRKDDKRTQMHSLVFGRKPGFFIDHINRNGLDNRKSNLRYATNEENTHNNASVGVYFFKQTGRWASKASISGKQIHIGYFDTYEEGKAARNRLLRSVYGEFIPE